MLPDLELGSQEIFCLTFDVQVKLAESVTQNSKNKKQTIHIFIENQITLLLKSAGPLGHLGVRGIPLFHSTLFPLPYCGP